MPAGPSPVRKPPGGHAPRAFTCHLAPPARHAATARPGSAPVRPGSSLPRSNYSDHARECEIHQRAATRHGTEVQATAAAQRIPPRLATVRHGTSQVTERTKGQRGGAVARPTRSPWVVVYMADTCRACTAPTQHARLIFYPYPIPTSSPALSGCRRRRRGLARRPAGLQAPLPLPGPELMPDTDTASAARSRDAPVRIGPDHRSAKGVVVPTTLQAAPFFHFYIF